ncbi:aminomethyl-transferring glycine dehydrogenase [Plasticicumulans acidivorans]|uniref:Glycine dehydrogenase (decarboxylating) n=1 Tax=Plasticicumulans acidivorans TaxID=886464 RepID=A0A317MQ72_9GAMM|nr:aminomethyl-transferring glycine dehydrogenase [Plasticicumulans acidivorans]PWV58723.1 glycine dehydrogenase (decarboxylating) [Plasticicumulans acidivorans]
MSQRRPLAELEQSTDFVRRHIGPDTADRARMLAVLGVESLDALVEQVVPAAIRRREPMALPAGVSEAQALAELRGFAAHNSVMKSLIGLGYYGTHTPSVVLRNVLENPAWYTAYTPYQPEISQGRLEALLNFQTMVAELSGMDIANASMLDEATAAAEAMTLCQRGSRSKSTVFFVDADCLPQTIAVVRTRAAALGIELVIGDPFEHLPTLECFGTLLQYPGASGAVRDFSAVTAAVQARKGLVVVAADLLALCLLTPPGEWGADVVVGSAQRFGVPMGFGGPHAGYLATRDAHKRVMPGRLVGVSVDSNGEPAYRLALQTREQHIRREKATSNICTAQALLAIMASLYACWHGPQGLRTIAARVHRLTAICAAGLRQLGYAVAAEPFFDTIRIDTSVYTQAIHEHAREAGYNLRAIDAGHIGLSLDETVTREDLLALWGAFAPAGAVLPDIDALDASIEDVLPPAQLRSSSFLTHPVFSRYHSETEMMRYLRKLADKDLALDRAMIPLGSCTMKLNAATEMAAITWPEFASLHPFVPAEQASGYHALIDGLEAMLCQATGYAAVSLQPNAGSQGEYAGLLVIRRYHESRGEGRRNICLIPSSAHGTNPASAHLAGLDVVVVACDKQGNIDLDDLRQKAAQHAEKLAAIMITYPSTHGVFEENVQEVCAIVHEHGGQVYIDGANMNALVGLAAPGQFGGDVSHLNLHKTFCIPHGGGGPGVGPVAVAAHLAEFLPGRGPRAIGPVSAAPYGSASILPISWTYIRLMGAEGLREATASAILAANYIAARLAAHYPVLYTGPNGRVAHECILDLRPLKDATGISVDDVAKRLIDFGFHAPTMSFPVPGTLMVEPTESESLAELDRFVEAMIAIREEIRGVETGALDAEDNPLKHAPHTAAVVLADDWNHRYPREQAAYPVAALRQWKYWSPVGRVDNVYGDRHLMCACVPVSDYA